MSSFRIIIFQKTIFLQQQFDILNSDTLGIGQVTFEQMMKNHQTSSDSSTLVSHPAEITQTFLQEIPVVYTTNSIQAESYDWMVYAVLVLTFGFSLIWYYLPERAISLFRLFDSQRDFRSRENVGAETPGIMIFFFFILNYVFTLSLFFYLTAENLFVFEFGNLNDNQFLIYILVSVIAFYLLRIIIIFATGIIFNTKEAAGRQLKLFINIDNIMGVLLIPVLYIILFVRVDFVFYLGIIIIFILHIFKWFQSFIIGNSILGFSILHLFMYLCTLEIIPLIILVKLFSNQLI